MNADRDLLDQARAQAMGGLHIVKRMSDQDRSGVGKVLREHFVACLAAIERERYG